MSAALPYVLGLAMFVTLLALVVGIVGFAFNGAFYNKHANTLMRIRVIGQGLAVATLGLIVFVVANS